MQTFDQFELKTTTRHAVRQLGFSEPTAVQADAIPQLLQGFDLIAQARTGTGKTAAFGIPMIEKLAALTQSGVVGLVLVPTRELATQVCDQLRALARGTNLRVAAVYGGVGFGAQKNALATSGPVLLVATPGRLLDHIAQRTLRLDGVRFLVLDEADRMLDMGFQPDVERIIKQTPGQRQTALFSATVPEAIKRLSKRFLRNPKEVRVEAGPVATPLAEQFKVGLQRAQKLPALLALFKLENPQCAIVFTRTKHLARRLANQLGHNGFPAVALEGNMSQGQRERALQAFRDGDSPVLVATDIASRGLDIPDVSHVVNYDVPVEPEAYVHRVGRTARMGRSGRAFTFVQSDQRRELVEIERIAGVTLATFDVGPLPVVKEETMPAVSSGHRGDRREHRPWGRQERNHQRPRYREGDRRDRPQGQSNGQRRWSQA